MHEDVPAPDEVNGFVLERHRFGSTGHETDTASHLRVELGDGGKFGARELDMARDGVEAGYGELKALGQLERVLPFAATNVDGKRSGQQSHVLDEVVEQLRSSRVQARVERGLERFFDPRVRVVGQLEPSLAGPEARRVGKVGRFHGDILPAATVAEASASLKSVGAITLFVEDPQRSKAFYESVFDLSPIYEDESAAAFRFENMIVNLLKVPAARELIDPAAVAGREAGSRFQLTIWVDDADAVCSDLVTRGVKLLNGPMNREWGMRTASFTDPDGHIWEIAQELPEAQGS